MLPLRFTQGFGSHAQHDRCHLERSEGSAPAINRALHVQRDERKRHPYIKLCLLLCIIMFPLIACSVSFTTTANGTPGANASGTPTLNVWSKGGPGVEVRYENWKSPSGAEDLSLIHI